MATLAMAPQKSPPARMPREATPHEIISSARNAPAGVKGALLVSGLSAILMWCAFTPVDFGPLGWVCLVPLLLLVRLERPTRLMYPAVWLSGLGFWLPTLQWMRLGDPTMYAAWVALAVYLAFYFPMFVGLSRVAVWRLRLPLMLAAPIVWVGLELLRGHLMTGFSWYLLGHTQYRWIELIQIADLTGAYGISFVVALAAACAAELAPRSLLRRAALLPPTLVDPLRPATFVARGWRVSVCLMLLGATMGYGYWRRAGADFKPGPRVALVQGNVPSEVKHDPRDWQEIQRRHEILTGKAVQQQPDLIIWPETMFRWPLFETPLDVSDDDLEAAHPELRIAQMRKQQVQVRKRLSNLGQMAGAGIVLGLETLEVDRQHRRTYNSAAFIRPDGRIAGRYDKLHRVIFGEYIPLADSIPWLRNLTPFAADFGIDAGTACSVFEHKGFRFAPIICFEDTIPHLVRNVLNVTIQPTDGGPKRVDFLVNLTNDGWFHGSSELDQHLITAAFRSVECRTPMVRAVNTGISAFIDGDGVIRRRAEDPLTHQSKQVETIVVDTIPLDDRTSPYLAGGDWFAGLCLAGCGLFLVTGIAGRFSRRTRHATATLRT